MSAATPNEQATVQASGSTISAPVPLSVADKNAVGPQVAVDQAGNAITVWRREAADDIVQASIRPAAGAFGTPPVGVSAAGASASAPQLAMNPASAVLAVWSIVAGGADPVVQAASRQAGGAFGGAVSLSTAGQAADTPTVAINQTGDASYRLAEQLCPAQEVARERGEDRPRGVGVVVAGGEVRECLVFEVGDDLLDDGVIAVLGLEAPSRVVPARQLALAGVTFYLGASLSTSRRCSRPPRAGEDGRPARGRSRDTAQRLNRVRRRTRQNSRQLPRAKYGLHG